MNVYKIQYWIYACLNKKFSKEVKIKRDPLHKIYNVNRHGIEIVTNNININKVYKWLIENLKKSQFIEEKCFDDLIFSKIFEKKQYYIYINKSRLNIKNKESIYLNVRKYKVEKI